MTAQCKLNTHCQTELVEVQALSELCAVIGACSLVTIDVEEHAVMLGVPAVKI